MTGGDGCGKEEGRVRAGAFSAVRSGLRFLGRARASGMAGESGGPVGRWPLGPEWREGELPGASCRGPNGRAERLRAGDQLYNCAKKPGCALRRSVSIRFRSYGELGKMK